MRNLVSISELSKVIYFGRTSHWVNFLLFFCRTTSGEDTSPDSSSRYSLKVSSELEDSLSLLLLNKVETSRGILIALLVTLEWPTGSKEILGLKMGS